MFPYPLADDSSNAMATLKEDCGDYAGMGEGDGWDIVATLE
jgi:hypothetical protein